MIYRTNEFKQGLKIMLDGAPCSILENEYVKPGKGQAFNRVKFRNLKTNRVGEKTFKSGDSVEGADVMEQEWQFLYSDGTHWTFMDPESFEQIMASAEAIGDAKLWIKGEELCLVTVWNGAPIQVLAPNFVTLNISETDPGLKGDTASGGSKSATLETGAVIRVPLFVQEGELVKVDTRVGEYVGRVKS